LNVMEHLDRPEAVLERLAATLKPGGAIVMLVPNVASLYGTLDRALGHRRRYSMPAARELLEGAGFQVSEAKSFNRVALLPWLLYSRVLHTGNISKLVLKLFDKSVWFWRRLDVLMPWPGLSLLVVARKPVNGRPAEAAALGRETARDAN